MKIIRRIALLALSALFCLPVPARADDTEIFAANPAVSGVVPNVLIILDNSANWSASFGGGTKFSAEMATLNSIIGTLNTNVNVGVMMFGENGPGTSTPITAYVRYAVRNMTAANKAGLQNMFTNLVINGDKGSNAPYGFALFEAFKYFGGGGTAASPQNSQNFGPAAFGGFGQPKRDYPGNPNNTFAGGLPGNAFQTSGSRAYVSPISDACQKNYVIFISNGAPPNGSDNGNPSASTLLSNVGSASAITTIPLPNVTAQGNLGDEYARFLYQSDVSGLAGPQNIITYTVNVYDPAHLIGSDPANIVLLESIANQGHGRYFAATSTLALTDALATIFNEVQATNTAFASVTLPVSVNVRGTNLNQVYLGVFRADPDGAPRWFGNLKQYQLGLNSSTNTVFLADANGLPAESGSTGFIVDSAVSFWTSASNFWAYSPSGNPLSPSDLPDGPVVEKGGAAERIRNIYPNPDSTAAQTRRIYTCNAACLATANAPLATYPFNTTTIVPGLAANISTFGAANSTEVTNIINWVRGMDNAQDENINGSLTDIRPSVHGDVLHSRPAVINYNRYGNDNDVVVYYGSNDGLFRAAKGGQNTSDGYEKWAFVAPEFYDRLKRLRDNLPPITAAALKPYFADGSVGVYQKDVNGDGKLVAADGDKVYLYVTMRRGGRMIYALDVSDPDNPKLLWRRDNTSPGWGELGQTWSMPQPRNVRGSVNPVLIFGAGYDPAVEDQDPVPSGVGNTMGRGIFVVDAFTGNVVWQAGATQPASLSPGEVFLWETRMTHAIPSDVAIIDRNNDGYADRVYVGDTGGNMWRIDIGNPSPDNWTVNKLASVGFDASGTLGSRRKFLYPPDVVYSSDANGPFDAVLAGSGDREHPFNGYGDAAHPLANAVTNRFYMFKDRSTGLSFVGSTYNESNLYDATANLIQTGSTSQQTAAQLALTAAGGWYITLGTGEKAVSSAVTLAGTTFFNTNQPNPPTPGACVSNLGIAREYTINFQNAAAPSPMAGLAVASRYITHPGGGYPPSPVAAIVNLNGKLQNVVISGTSVLKPPASPLGARIRTFWKR
ncbi:MAG: pilus assembly protein PilY [Burkholderiales bacterium]